MRAEPPCCRLSELPKTLSLPLEQSSWLDAPSKSSSLSFSNYDHTFNPYCHTFYQAFFRPKTNNKPLKKVFKSCGQLSKNCQKSNVIVENKEV